MHVDRDSIFLGRLGFGSFILDYKTDSIYRVSDKYPYAKVDRNLWTYKILENNNGVIVIHQTNKITIVDKIAGKAYETTSGFFEAIVDIALSYDKKKLYAATKTRIYQWESAHKWKPVISPNTFLAEGTAIRAIGTINDHIWVISTDNKIVNLDPVSKEYTKVDILMGKANLIADPVRIHQSDATTIWMGSRSDGMLRINLATNSVQSAKASTDPNSILKNFILSFLRAHKV